MGPFRPGQPAAAVARTFARGEFLFAYVASDICFPIIYCCLPHVPTPTRGKPANVQWGASFINDDNWRYSLAAIREIEISAQLKLQSYDQYIPEGNHLLARFDGSFRKRQVG